MVLNSINANKLIYDQLLFENRFKVLKFCILCDILIANTEINLSNISHPKKLQRILW